MKKYKASSKWFNIALLISFFLGRIIGAILGYPALFSWSLFSLCLLVIFLTPWRYCFACGALWINEKAIMQGTSLKNCSRVIERTAAVLQAYEIFGVLYYAFSTHPLKNCNKKQLLSLVRHKEAILYPWMPQMVHDFPEIFSHKDNS